MRLRMRSLKFGIPAVDQVEEHRELRVLLSTATIILIHPIPMTQHHTRYRSKAQKRAEVTTLQQPCAGIY